MKCPKRIRAEFEEQKSLFVTWPLEKELVCGFDCEQVTVRIIKEALSEVAVHIDVYDSEMLDYVKNYLKNEHVHSAKLSFRVYPYAIMYPRDFGPEIVFEEGKPTWIDFDFNAYGLFRKNCFWNQDLIEYAGKTASLFAIEKGGSSRLITEGGNHEFNGQGTMISILETEKDKRNPLWTTEQIEREFKNHFGLQQIIWLEKGTFDDENPYMGKLTEIEGRNCYRCASANGHIDEFCRFVSADTVVLAQVSEEQAQNSQLARLNKERCDAAKKRLENIRLANGKKLRIVALPIPEPFFIKVRERDALFSYFTFDEARIQNHLFLDGSDFPKKDFYVLPAMSYCNFLMINQKVLVQTYAATTKMKVHERQDRDVINCLKQLFPDKEIVAIESLSLNLGGGGIHCHTRNLPC